MPHQIVGSIVTFNPNFTDLRQTISTFLEAATNSVVYVWDNSDVDRISHLLSEEFGGKIRYIKSPSNLGFGAGHNAVFRNIDQPFEYFCILNPDLIIPKESISSLTAYLKSHDKLGLVSGLVRGEDMQIQPVHKELPSFFSYIASLLKRFLKISNVTTGTNIDLDRKEPYSLPVISGCFLLLTKKHFNELMGFDERFFLYFEDYDLTLRSYLMGKSVIIPEVSIVHKWARGSSRNKKLLLLHIKSGLKFYAKWGFFFKPRQKRP